MLVKRSIAVKIEKETFMQNFQVFCGNKEIAIQLANQLIKNGFPTGRFDSPRLNDHIKYIHFYEYANSITTSKERHERTPEISLETAFNMKYKPPEKWHEMACCSIKVIKNGVTVKYESGKFGYIDREELAPIIAWYNLKDTNGFIDCLSYDIVFRLNGCNIYKPDLNELVEEIKRVWK